MQKRWQHRTWTWWARRSLWLLSVLIILYPWAVFASWTHVLSSPLLAFFFPWLCYQGAFQTPVIWAMCRVRKIERPEEGPEWELLMAAGTVCTLLVVPPSLYWLSAWV